MKDLIFPIKYCAECGEKLSRKIIKDKYTKSGFKKETLKKFLQRKFCGFKCAGKHQYEKNMKNPDIKQKMIYANKGKKFSKDHCAKISRRLTGEGNGLWKGDLVGYKTLHSWVYRHKGKPDKCSFCGKSENLEWANKSGLYKREVGDWISLCSGCHHIYDRQNLTKGHSYNIFAKNGHRISA